MVRPGRVRKYLRGRLESRALDPNGETPNQLLVARRPLARRTPMTALARGPVDAEVEGDQRPAQIGRPRRLLAVPVAEPGRLRRTK
jgi:hypothetical protein